MAGRPAPIGSVVLLLLHVKRAVLGDRAQLKADAGVLSVPKVCRAKLGCSVGGMHFGFPYFQ